jgi:hypothetical protein
MTDLEVKLQAQITAQNLIIEALLDACVGAGILDGGKLVARLGRYVEAPRAEWVPDGVADTVDREVRAWADMVAGVAMN